MNASLSLRLAVVALAALPLAAAAAPVDYNRQVLPVLSENCFACHGPDAKQRKAGLRFDTKEGAFTKLPSGRVAVVPGKSDASALVERIASADPERMMPPPRSHKTLKKEEVEILRRWVDEGAKWAAHWAFVPPKRPAVPQVRNPKFEIRNPIDAFILARLEQEGLSPNPEADPVTLIRRVTLDLTGLPPTPNEVAAFLKEWSATPQAAYEKVVDRLLASPRYGEHRARFWLDAARYGDTHGLHLDNYREIWPYRDWVIKAFNDNKPFDKFVIEQLAGDLLPDATLEQRVATGFNRCHVSTSEGGSIEEECYVRNVVDRVDTTGTVFLGLTVGCSRCHDHKFDPVTQKDYYALFAFFNSIEGSALDGNAAQYPPVARVAGPEQVKELERLRAAVTAVKEQIAEEVAKVTIDEAPEEPAKPQVAADFVWIDDSLPPGAKSIADGNLNVAWEFVGKPAPVQGGTKSVRVKATGLRQVVLTDANPGLKVGAGDKLFAYVWLDPKDPPQEVMLQWHTSNWLHRVYWGKNKIEWGRDNSTERFRAGELPETGKWVRLEVEAAKVGIAPGTVINGWAFTQFDGTAHYDTAGLVTQTPQGTWSFDSFAGWLKAQRAANGAGLPPAVQNVAKIADEKRTPEQTKQLRDYFIEHVYSKPRTTFAPLHQRLKEAEQALDKFDKALPATLVWKEGAPRPSFVLKRGEYDQKGAKVERATPGFLPPPPEPAKDRLALARWLVAAEQPLTARVAVNRFWQSVFGLGLVKTADDFGSQGEPPSHPELLDWLAIEFRESGWDVKKLLRLIVTSSAYRQSAKLMPEKLAKDRENRLLSRGPRFRLDAEGLRDQALFASGLIVEKLGGPSVKPPQPAGLWEAVGYTGSNTANFRADTGHEKVHRRSLYTFWKRTAPPPQMSIADAPSREACTVRRERTNTPLQALLLLNETQYVECARALAERAMKEAGTTPEARLTHMFRLAAARAPDPAETAELLGVVNDMRAKFAKDPEGAKKLLAVGETKPDPKLDPAELAAYAMAANVILNLDEVLNK
jgi:mono/diheme cytochrome c family protein